MSFLSELRERKVVRMAIYYAIAGWGLLQVADIATGLLELPAWTLRLTLAVIVACFPLALVLSWLFRLTPGGLVREVSPAAASHPPTTRPGVGVLPLRTTGNGVDDEYLADGLSEEILHALNRSCVLRVPSRRSCFGLRACGAQTRQAAERLGIDHLLDGTLERRGSDYRVNVELVSTASDNRLWTKSYERTSDELASLPPTIAREIATVLGVTGDAAGKQQRPQSAVAFHEFLRGLHALRSGTADGVRSAAELFDQALALEPGFARAWAGLSLAYSWLARYGVVTPADGFRRARAAAERALALDDRLADAHLALADDRLFGQRDFPAAEASLRRALELEPENAEIHGHLAHYLGLQRRWDEALALRRQAIELDPLSQQAYSGYADTLFLAARYEEALHELDRLREMAPDYPTAHLRARIALARSRPEEAIEHISRERLEWRRLYISAIAHHLLGDTASARDALERLQHHYGDQVAVQAAIVHAQFGEPDEAFGWLQVALEQSDPGIVELMADPELEPLRRDPRYERLLEEAGLRSAPSEVGSTARRQSA